MVVKPAPMTKSASEGSTWPLFVVIYSLGKVMTLGTTKEEEAGGAGGAKETESVSASVCGELN